MSKELKLKKYEQLNQRSNWYSSQIWYIPFAYITIIGIVIGKVVIDKNFSENNYFYYSIILLGLFSNAIIIHILSLQFFERVMIKRLRDEGFTISKGLSPFYLNFTTYMITILIIISFSFLNYGLNKIDIIPNNIFNNPNLKKFIINIILSLFYLLIFIFDVNRHTKMLKSNFCKFIIDSFKIKDES